MVYIKHWLDPEAKLHEALGQIASARNSVNTIQFNWMPDFTIMTWNIQTLGGGIGRSAVRDDEEIEAMAKIIHAVSPDICILVEIMRHGQTPSKPQFIQPRETRVPRSGSFHQLINAAVDDAKKVKAILGRGPLDPERNTIFKFQNTSLTPAQFKMDGIEKLKTWQDEQIIAMEIVRAHLIARCDSLKETAKNFFTTLRGQTIEDLLDSVPPELAAIRPQFKTNRVKTNFDDDETVADLYDEFSCTEWYHLPASVYTGHLDKSGKDRTEYRYKVADALQSHLRANLTIELAKDLFETTAPLEADLIALRPEIERFVLRQQNTDEALKRRQQLYDEYRAAWEAARNATHHPGAYEVLRIYEVLNMLTERHSYSVWPALHNPDDDNVDGDRPGKKISNADIDTHILYTENETYAVFYRHKNFYGEPAALLKSVSRLGGFEKRAPFVFEFEALGNAINVMAWHAPSDSKRNKSVRTKDFKTFRDTLEDLGGGDVPLITVGDFNIKTPSNGYIDNADCSFTVKDFFASFFDAPSMRGRSLFWGHYTSLKQAPILSDSNTSPRYSQFSRYEHGASAFDWIGHRIGDDDLLTIYWEAIVPVLPMLAARNEATWLYFPPYYVEVPAENDVGFICKLRYLFDDFDPQDTRSYKPELRSGFLVTGIDGLAGCLPSNKARGPFKSPFDFASDLLARARRLSDHLPVAVQYKMKTKRPAREDVAARGTAVRHNGYARTYAGKIVRPDEDGWKKRGSDSLFGAVMKMVDKHNDRFQDNDDALIAYPAGTEPDQDTDSRIAALRMAAAQELDTNTTFYKGLSWSFFGDWKLPEQVAKMGANNQGFGENLALNRAIAEVLGISFGIYDTWSKRMETFHPITEKDRAYRGYPNVTRDGNFHW